MDFNKDDEYKTLVINAFTSCIPYINEIYPNLVKDIPNLGLLQKRTLIKTILATTTNIIDDKTCDIIDKLVKCELNSKGIFDVDTIPPFGKVKQTIISLWLGNIVRLQIDVIVNAVSNPYCLGCNIPLHYCLDSSIHTFAGPRLKNGSKLLIKNSDDWKKPLDTGESRITKAYCLPCKYIIHTKGPICQESTIEDKNNLISCYINSLNLAKSMGLRTIAFSCISSGLHSFQPIESSKIAIDTVKSYLEKPENLNSFMKMIKISDHFLTRSEVACALSHISLWVKCVEDDVPLVVLEHDAIMIAPYPEHTMYNSISYLGCAEQFKQNWKVFPTPPHGSMGKNYHFLLRTHSYSIDPAVAKNMLAHVLKYGINSSADCMLRADIFPIHQMGVYAYDEGNFADSTILNRAGTDRSTIRNDNLER